MGTYNGIVQIILNVNLKVKCVKFDVFSILARTLSIKVLPSNGFDDFHCRVVPQHLRNGA